MSDVQTHLCQHGNQYSSMEAAAECRPAKEAATGRPHEIVGRKGKRCFPNAVGGKQCSDTFYYLLRPIPDCFFNKKRFRIGYPSMNYREEARKCLTGLQRMADQLRRDVTFSMACTDPGTPVRQMGCWIYRKEGKNLPSTSKK